MQRMLILIALGIVCTGCVATGPLPDYGSTDSAVAYMDMLIDATTPSNLDQFIDTTDDGEGDSYRWYTGWWCPSHESVDSLYAVKGQFVSYCESRGGSYDAAYFCREDQNPDNVLFFAKFWRSSECSMGETVAMKLLEPTAGFDNQGYVEQLKEYGYMTTAELAAAEAERAHQAQLAKEEAQRKQERDLAAAEVVAASNPGTRICKEGVVDYVREGFTREAKSAPGLIVAQLDGLSDDRRQLRFRVLGHEIPTQHDNELTRSDSYRMGDFSIVPGTVYWDAVHGWAVCAK